MKALVFKGYGQSDQIAFADLPRPMLYASTKHAVEGYSESLDHEVRAFGIRSVLVESGFTRTSVDENPLKANQPLPAYADIRTNIDALLHKRINTGDTPEIVANVVLRASSSYAPRLRYSAGKSAVFLHFLRRFFLASFADEGIHMFGNLPNVKTNCCFAKEILM